MTQTPLTPTRKKQLQRYIACCARAERRIIIGVRNAHGACIDLSRFSRLRPLIEHITSSSKPPRDAQFTSALWRLRLARSKYQCELEGLPWHA